MICYKNTFRSKHDLKLFLLSVDDKKELEEMKKRYNELSEKMMEKNRQYLKLQVNNLCVAVFFNTLVIEQAVWLDVRNTVLTLHYSFR